MLYKLRDHSSNDFKYVSKIFVSQLNINKEYIVQLITLTLNILKFKEIPNILHNSTKLECHRQGNIEYLTQQIVQSIKNNHLSFLMSQSHVSDCTRPSSRRLWTEEYKYKYNQFCKRCACVEANTMTAYRGSGNIASFIPNLETTCRWVMRLRPRPLYSRLKSPLYLQKRCLVEPKPDLDDNVEESIVLTLKGFEKPDNQFRNSVTSPISFNREFIFELKSITLTEQGGSSEQQQAWRRSLQSVDSVSQKIWWALLNKTEDKSQWISR